MLSNFHIPTVYFQDETGNVQKQINLLFNEQVPAIVIKQFFNQQQCQSVVSKAWEHDFFWLKKPLLGRIGATLAQFHLQEDGEQNYFTVSKQINSVLDWLYAESGSPLEALSNLLSPDYETSVAYDPDFQAHYAAGMVQIQINQGKVHTDKVSIETPHWTIGKIVKTQFSSVLYLQMPDADGALELYNRQWQESDINFAFSPDPRVRKGVEDMLVDGCQKVVYQPKMGDMLILNTSFYHRVRASEGENPRMVGMSFLGMTEEGKILYFM